MNNFAGIISFSSVQDEQFLRRLRHRFPKHCSGMKAIDAPQLQACGAFQPSTLNTHLSSSALYLVGEIFNSGELARTTNAVDSEQQDNATLLHTLILQKGLDALAGVNGQFFIIYVDVAERTTHLLTDHGGVQQVFYHQGNGFFIFASDAKFLFAHPQCNSEVDWETGLRRPYPHTVLNGFRSYKTWFKQVRLLPEAADCRIDYKAGSVHIRRFWNGLYDYSLAARDDQRNGADVMEEYMALLDDAVKIRTNDGDTAYSFLSGGLDSSAICALAAKHKPLESFSIINQTCVLEGTTFVCDRLSKELGFGNKQFLIPYHELVFNKRLWKQRIWRTESPVNHTDALTKNLLHYAIGKLPAHVPYVLTGTGSDQLNGGLVRWIVNDQDDTEQNADTFFKKVKESEMRQLISRDDEGLWRIRQLLSPDFLQQISGQKLQDNPWMYYVQSALHGEAYSLLWDELRAAAAHHRSVRFPFLDYRFIPFIAAIPVRLHKELFYDKQILRTPAKKILPEYITTKDKAPSFIPHYDFRFPLFNFLTSGADSLLEEAFASRGTPHPVIDKEQLWKRVEAMQRKPEIYEWQALISIMNMGLLEQLGGKDESDLDCEKDMDAPELISFENPHTTKIVLQQRLGINTEEAMLAQPLQFCEGCALLQDYRNGNFFLAKNNTLAYEIEDEYVGWRALLQAIDGRRSTQALLDETKVSFESIREFFTIALKEQILTVGMPVSEIKKEAALA